MSCAAPRDAGSSLGVGLGCEGSSSLQPESPPAPAPVRVWGTAAPGPAAAPGGAHRPYLPPPPTFSWRPAAPGPARPPALSDIPRHSWAAGPWRPAGRCWEVPGAGFHTPSSVTTDATGRHSMWAAHWGSVCTLCPGPQADPRGPVCGPGRGQARRRWQLPEVAPGPRQAEWMAWGDPCGLGVRFAQHRALGQVGRWPAPSRALQCPPMACPQRRGG